LAGQLVHHGRDVEGAAPPVSPSISSSSSRPARPGLRARPGGLVRPAASAPPAGPPPGGVVGGRAAAAGKWPDIVAVYVGNIPFCSGVLVAPTVVLTAAHCNTSGLAEVLIGAETLAAGNGGERRNVLRRIEYPDWDATFDVLVLVLDQPSTRPPRPLASGWAGAEVVDGHDVQVVGFGAIDPDGMTFVDPLQEATTKITDAGCARASGCNAEALPAGELGAGGMGIDSCSGDSGGPLYITGPLGTFVAGLTSRSYDNAGVACSEGGIYTRADRVADWIEREAGVPIERGPEPSFDPLDVAVGTGAQTKISPGDPMSEKHRYAIAAQPARGSAIVDARGVVKMCATGVGPGTDRIVVEITDATRPSRKILTTVPVSIRDGVDDGGCELPDDGGCGCQTSAASRAGVGGWLLAVATALVLPRRRRRVRFQRVIR
jgi:MYXO-CTERM domain-containing protein